MGSLKGGGTIGFWYLMGLHMGAGRGPVDELIEIRVGGLTAWEGCLSSFGVESTGSETEIEAENLFGGEEKEGGIVGPLKVMWGGPEQLCDAGLAAELGGNVPGFRGVTTFYFDGKVCAFNPYPKEWAFRVRRARQGWYNEECWYEHKARIGMLGPDDKPIIAMNAAHMLYEIATNPEWGRGLPADFIDENSYIYAANYLCAEGLGLCIPWFRQEDIGTFTQVVIDHISAAQYVSRETGKLTLKLIRDDYVVADLPLFTPETGLIEVEDDDQSASDTGFNEIIVVAHDPISNTDFSVRAHNLAAIQSVGSIISNTIQYKGLPTRELAQRKAASELRLQNGIRKPNIVLDRRGWKIAPGMPFRIAWPERGIPETILRAAEVRDGTPEKGAITIACVTDVFKMPAEGTTGVDVEPPAWVPPDFTAYAPSATKLIELPYRTLYQKLPAGELAALTEDQGGIGELAAAPTEPSTATGYDLLTKTSVEPAYVKRGTGTFTGYATVMTDVAPLDTAIALTLPVGFDNPVGQAALLGDEYVRIDAYDTGTGIATVGRGVIDTVPATHVSGTLLWLADDDMGYDSREYVVSEVVFAKALTRTSTQVLAEGDAAEDSITITGRQARPYPPAGVEVEGDSIYALDSSPTATDFNITWTERNRITQADTLIDHDDATVSPEVGTTYNIRFINASDGITVLDEVTGIVGTSYLLDAAEITALGDPASVIVELESERDGLTSFQYYRFVLPLKSGWGLGWGLNWGGAV
jgi:hypothetical protein